MWGTSLMYLLLLTENYFSKLDHFEVTLFFSHFVISEVLNLSNGENGIPGFTDFNNMGVLYSLMSC